jgi:hypothetical protein
MQLYARQGDLVFDKRKLTGEFAEESGVVLAGQNSAAHTVMGKVGVRREGLTTFLRVKQTTEVTHAGRHKSVTLEAGDYEIRPLRERGSGEDRAVED